MVEATLEAFEVQSFRACADDCDAMMRSVRFEGSS
jgi:hypothetical protein